MHRFLILIASLLLLPGMVINDAGNRVGTYGISFGEFITSKSHSVQFSNFINLASAKLVGWILLACCTTSFCDPIRLIIKWATKKQMRGVYARRIVASVTNIHSFWNVAKMNNPRSSMCGDAMIMGRIMREHSITLRYSDAFPRPATLLLLDKFPKPFAQRFSYV